MGGLKQLMLGWAVCIQFPFLKCSVRQSNLLFAFHPSLHCIDIFTIVCKILRQRLDY